MSQHYSDPTRADDLHALPDKFCTQCGVKLTECESESSSHDSNCTYETKRVGAID